VKNLIHRMKVIAAKFVPDRLTRWTMFMTLVVLIGVFGPAVFVWAMDAPEMAPFLILVSILGFASGAGVVVMFAAVFSKRKEEVHPTARLVIGSDGVMRFESKDGARWGGIRFEEGAVRLPFWLLVADLEDDKTIYMPILRPQEFRDVGRDMVESFKSYIKFWQKQNPVDPPAPPEAP